MNQAHVCHDITVEKLDGIVGNIKAANFITFTDDLTVLGTLKLSIFR